MALPNTNTSFTAIKRVRIWYAFFIACMVIFGLRLFYVQVIRYDHYKTAALSDQLKQYDIPASRGLISAHSYTGTVPIVLNQQLYTLYGDPAYIKDPAKVAEKLAAITRGDEAKYLKLLKTPDTRYVVLAKKIDKATQAKVAALKEPGVGTIGQDYRTYTQGSLAAQLLGFVNDEGTGEYGVEQALNKELGGRPGKLKAITDVRGVPLAASKDNTETAPVNGKNVLLTIDLSMQQQLEKILQKGVKGSKASSGSALIMDPHTGAIKAMANMPTYSPAEYFKVEDPKVFQNAAAANPIEIGSIMKTLTTAAALDKGVINPGTTYYDPSFWTVDKFKITNIEEDGGAGRRSIGDILNLSLNTGATWELMQLGGGEINSKARQTWHDYLVNRYLFGKQTGIEQGYEATGYVPSPAENGAGIDLTYANTSFGQAMTATPVQVAGALSAALNGGTYYQPRLVDSYTDGNGNETNVKPKVIKQGVVSKTVSKELVPLLQYVVQNHSFSVPFDQDKYIVGGKTGTAQIAKPNGGYHDDEFNGTYAGFVGGDEVKYVIVVFVIQPKVAGYAGSAAAQPIFGDLAHMLINNSFVAPKTP